MRLFRKYKYELVACFASKCKKPKLRSNHATRCTWDFDYHFVNGIRTKFWIETSWGTNAYFEYNGDWYRFPMQQKKYPYDDVLNFGQEFNKEFIFENVEICKPCSRKKVVCNC